MDIAEFAEKFMNIELKDWQKNHLRTLENLHSDGSIHVIMRSRKQVYIYMDQLTRKGLIRNGQASHCSNQMSAMR